MTASSGHAPRQPSHSKQFPHDRQRPASYSASVSASPPTTSSNPRAARAARARAARAGRRRRSTTACSMPNSPAGAPALARRRRRAAMRRSRARRCLPCRTPTVTVRSAGTMSPPANTPGAPVINVRGHLHSAVALELHTWHRAQEGRVALLAEREDQGIRVERLDPPRGLRVARFVELHHLDLDLLALERLDRAQPVDPHALALGILRLLLVRRHLLTRAPIDNQRLLGAHPSRRARRVHSGVAAAVYCDAPADHRLLARGHGAQEGHGVDDLAGIGRGDLHPLGEVRADRDEDRVEGALAPLGIEVPTMWWRT